MLSEKDLNLHNKHRERVRKEFLAKGFSDDTPPHKILEMVLFYSIPRKDTNELAHILLKHFKTIENVLEASPEELKAIDGIGDNTIALFKLMLHIIKSYRDKKVVKDSLFKNYEEIYEYIFNKFIGIDKEQFCLISFNVRGECIGFDVLSKGDLTTVTITPRMILEIVFKRNAGYVILAHNHPGGDPLPSNNDVKTTEKVKKLLADINVGLLDHIIVSDCDYISMRQSANLKYIFEDYERSKL